MGLETKTSALVGKDTSEGKLYLDSKTLDFRSKSFKWSMELGPTVQAIADGKWLVVSSGRSKARFLIDKGIERWIDKILNPPSRIKKLGVKPVMKLFVSKGFGSDFITELKTTGCTRTAKIDKCDLAFWMVGNRTHLSGLETALGQLEPGTNIWVVWPKKTKTDGTKAITKNDVMTSLQRMDFGPSKTAAFSDTHSSMRFARKKQL